MPAKFRVYPPVGEPFERIIENTATIGRTLDNTVALRGNHVSRQHAIVRCHNAFQYQIMDLGSRNGTFVNDQRVIMPIVLEPGARVRIADFELVFEQNPGDQSGDHTDATLAALSHDTSHAILSVSLLVCDILGFSPMAETLGVRNIAQVLGNCLLDIANAVQSTDGITYKYIDHGALATWLA